MGGEAECTPAIFKEESGAEEILRVVQNWPIAAAPTIVPSHTPAPSPMYDSSCSLQRHPCIHPIPTYHPVCDPVMYTRSSGTLPYGSLP